MWHEIRKALVNHLKEAHELLQGSLSDIDLVGFLANFPEVVTPDDADPRYSYGLIVRKIGFHIAAILLANQQNNVHSAGVHARVLMGCAAEIVPLGAVAAEGTSEALERVLKLQEYDATYLLSQMSRGQIPMEDVRETVKKVREAIGLPYGKLPTGVFLTDRAASLTQGRGWYTYLSDNFCHTKADRLKEVPALGGVLPAPETQLDAAFIIILNCALTYICQSLVSYGGIRISVGDSSKYFDDALVLSDRVRETAAPFRESLTQVRRSVADGEEN